MLRHFAPDHEVFRGGPLRRAPNQTTAPTATLLLQNSQVTPATNDKPLAVWDWHVMQKHKTETEREREKRERKEKVFILCPPNAIETVKRRKKTRGVHSK